MTLSSRQLRGTPYEVARLYGMPHIGAKYTGESVNAYRMDEGAVCPVCGMLATNAHHEPPKGSGRTFGLNTEWGTFVLKPALIALCGSGTTGCHGKRHNGLLTFRWEWDSSDYEGWWFDGKILSHGYAPHDSRLYEIGKWVVYDGMEAVSEWRG